MENFNAPHHHVEYVGETNEAFNKGDKYSVCVTKMSDGIGTPIQGTNASKNKKYQTTLNF